MAMMTNMGHIALEQQSEKYNYTRLLKVVTRPPEVVG
jgi:hypothetical protein